MTAFLPMPESQRSNHKGAIRHVRVRTQNRKAALALGDKHARTDERVLAALLAV
jgi:hypothetical protein